MAPPPQPPLPQGNIYAQAMNSVNGPLEQDDRWAVVIQDISITASCVIVS